MNLCIGISGAGTAGLAAAISLARSGYHVTVFEKHASIADLGAGLLIQPQGVYALEQLGVGDAFRHISTPINHIKGVSHRAWVLADIHYQQPARAVRRAALAHLLCDTARQLGVEIRYSSAVDNIKVETNKTISRANGTRQEHDLFVIADGASSTLPLQAGLSSHSTSYDWGALWGMFDVEHWAYPARLEQRYQGTHTMFGLMPTEEIGTKLKLSLFWSLRVDAYTQWRARSISDWKKELLALWPESEAVVSQIHSHDQLTLASYRHARTSRMGRARVGVIGDAAHSMSPQLGLGATLAVQDAMQFADAVNTAGPVDGPSLFSTKRLRTVQAYQALSRVLTPCFQANHGGWLRDMIFATGLHIPGIPYLMHRSVAEPVLRKVAQ